MRKKHIILLSAIWIVLSQLPCMAQHNPLISSAKSLDELTSSFEKEYGNTPVQVFETNNAKVAVFLPDVASGLSLRAVLIYVHNDDGTWSLVLNRATNTSHVSIDFEKSTGLLTFKSKAGKLLMTIPADSLVTGFDRSEQ